MDLFSDIRGPESYNGRGVSDTLPNDFRRFYSTQGRQREVLGISIVSIVSY